MINSPSLHRQIFRVCLSIFLVVFALSSTGCDGRKGGQSSGTEGDYVSGTPLPERREGTRALHFLAATSNVDNFGRSISISTVNRSAHRKLARFRKSPAL
jgi:hypothetical protein